MEFIDTHTHLYLPEFDADRADVVARAVGAGAVGLLLPGLDEASLPPALAMCRRWPGLCRPMLGLHPTELPPDPMAALDRLERLLVPGHPFVAIGEVGIDLYWDTSRCEEQVAVFRRQVAWAAAWGLPLSIHARAAHAELVEVLAPWRDRLSGGVFHCFGGTEDEARELLGFPGFVLGIGGVVTFKKSALPAVLAAAVPLERIVVETDAPYLAPTPHRGRRNESAYVPLVLERLAEVYGCPAGEVARVTTRTARAVFRL